MPAKGYIIVKISYLYKGFLETRHPIFTPWSQLWDMHLILRGQEIWPKLDQILIQQVEIRRIYLSLNKSIILRAYMNICCKQGFHLFYLKVIWLEAFRIKDGVTLLTLPYFQFIRQLVHCELAEAFEVSLVLSFYRIFQFPIPGLPPRSEPVQVLSNPLKVIRIIYWQ